MILQRYILREVVFSFLFTFAVVMAVFLVGMSYQVFRAYSSIGLEVLAQMIPLAGANAGSWAILLSVPPSLTLVYGRLAADNEIDAMRISGIATRRMVAPALFFSVLVCIAMYGVVEYAVPQANYAKRMLLREFSIKLLKSPPPGKQFFKFDTFELSYLDAVDGVMQMPFLTQYGTTRPQDPRGVTKTDTIALTGRALIEEGKPVRIELKKWIMVQNDESGRQTFASAENEIVRELPLDRFIDADRRPENLRWYELLEVVHKAKSKRQRDWYLTVFYSRFAQSLAPFLLALVSVPIGIIVRRGSRLAGLGAALPPLLVYIVAHLVFQGTGQNGRLAPPLAAFAPDAILLSLGSVFLWRTCRR